MANSLLSFSYKGMEALLQSQYVSRQYLDNFGVKENSLDPYFVHHLSIAYRFKARHTKGVTVGLTVYNLFDTQYETNGYAQNAALYPDKDKQKLPHMEQRSAFLPRMAGTNVLGHVTIRF